MILSEEILQHYRSNQGYVYLIHAEGTNRYKIGRSVNPVTRLEQLKAQSPYPLRIIDSFWTPDAINDEKYFHEQYKEYRRFGEWFEFSDSSLPDWNHSHSDSQEQLLEKYSQSLDYVKDSFYLFRKEAQNISDNIAFEVTKNLINNNEFQSFVISIPPNFNFSVKLLLKVKFKTIFYENILQINTLKSLQYICDFGIKHWANCVMTTFEKSKIFQKEITLDELEISIRSTIAGFSACLSGGVIV
ncbi:GIY-YIG nuclease family protein [Nostoc sp. UHCC 0870]|uniref:GIY-YIG nuclease family protein n=1 Tax=Nostoc sp. UHCC 0870 TaxID=2914041 RepID=UPI001EDE67FB|nr:GIY-YIG nuclease family protein [Nostoc sp. UHCC 0870]UKP00970.1 GIY-YIG nuclease family protein [Nostoc sp. UHCC 0870]